VIATGDPSLAEIIRFHKDPAHAGLRLLRQEEEIFVDIKMMEAEWLKRPQERDLHLHRKRRRPGQGKRHHQDIRWSLGLPGRAIGSIILIGNAPSALLTLCDLMESGKVAPLL
jgi:precorrin-8X/cobalt-precorrin-8 methylmutase